MVRRTGAITFGSRRTCAAAAGGVTTIVCMPNTDPVVDSAAVLGSLVELACVTDGKRDVLEADDLGATLGDIGHVDAEGYVYLTDRRNAMVISGGVKIGRAHV